MLRLLPGEFCHEKFANYSLKISNLLPSVKF